MPREKANEMLVGVRSNTEQKAVTCCTRMSYKSVDENNSEGTRCEDENPSRLVGRRGGGVHDSARTKAPDSNGEDAKMTDKLFLGRSLSGWLREWSGSAFLL